MTMLPITTQAEALQMIWDAYVQQQCGWQDADGYHGHTDCSNKGVGAAGLVFEQLIPTLGELGITHHTPEHFESKERQRHDDR